MDLQQWLARQPGKAPESGIVRLVVEAIEWRAIATDLATSGGRLLALWATSGGTSAGSLHAVATALPHVVVVEVRLPANATSYPGIADLFPCAARMQRAIRDLNGLEAVGATDTRPWVRHAAWPADAFPLRDRDLPPPAESPVDDYAFVRVEGDGVHEIAVGPVHAGTIEPGHFRFSVVGEKVLRLEERLGYVHKGIERRFTEFGILEGHRLAARVSGDSGVAYSWAYCEALERMTGTQVPVRAVWLRALALELERAANHLGDLGALGNDAGFAFGLSQFLRLKEGLLRTTERALGQRYLLDLVVPGGTQRDLASDGAEALARCATETAAEVQVLRDIYEEHSGLRDRFLGAGRLDPETAAWLGVIGLAGRASDQPLDLRIDLPQEPYANLGLQRALQGGGDVLARVTVRFDELLESLRMVRAIAGALPPGSHRVAVTAPDEGAAAVGIVEGWRGPVVVGLEAGLMGTIRRCHPQDPSWHNWPALGHAIIGNIVPDFPLINKSFNLSYSGQDL